MFVLCWFFLFFFLRAAAAQREAESIKLAPIPEPIQEPDPTPLPTPTPAVMLIEDPPVIIEEPVVLTVVAEGTVREPTPEGSSLFNNIAKRVSVYSDCLLFHLCMVAWLVKVSNFWKLIISLLGGNAQIEEGKRCTTYKAWIRKL